MRALGRQDLGRLETGAVGDATLLELQRGSSIIAMF